MNAAGQRGASTVDRTVTPETPGLGVCAVRLVLRLGMSERSENIGAWEKKKIKGEQNKKYKMPHF